MVTRPEIFISATSKDLKSCRQLVRDELLTLGCHPVVQEHFVQQGHELRQKLRNKIKDCHAVIHIAGNYYGLEPLHRDASEPRLSYTQMEYAFAREFGKEVFVFICEETFPYDAHESETEELFELQQEHRALLLKSDYERTKIKSPAELRESVGKLQPRVEKLREELEKAREALEKQNAVLHKEIESFRAQLDRQTKLTERILAKVDPNATPAVAGEKHDAVVAAQIEIAHETGLSLSELKKQLAAEGADVRMLLTEINERRLVAVTQAEEWICLQRDTLIRIGHTEYAAGHYAIAIEPYRQALAFIDEKKEPLVWIYAAQNLEIALDCQGRYSEAEPLARQVVEKFTALQGAEHPDTLGSVNNLAALLHAKGDYLAAEPLYRQVLQARERAFGIERSETLTSINNLANLLLAKGDYDEAEPLYRHALEMRAHKLGIEHPDTLASLNNLAALLHARGDYLAAEPLYRRALHARECKLGKEHPETLTSVNNLAILLSDIGDHAGAEPLYYRALQARERMLGKEHPNTLTSVNNLALSLTEKGDHVGAELLYRRALETQERTLGKQHPDTLASVSNLANLFQAKGDYVTAEGLYRRALEGWERTFGKEHPDTIKTARNFSLLRKKQGQLTEALRLAKQAAVGAQKSLPIGHPHRLIYEQHLVSLQAQSALPKVKK